MLNIIIYVKRHSNIVRRFYLKSPKLFRRKICHKKCLFCFPNNLYSKQLLLLFVCCIMKFKLLKLLLAGQEEARARSRENCFDILLLPHSSCCSTSCLNFRFRFSFSLPKRWKFQQGKSHSHGIHDIRLRNSLQFNPSNLLYSTPLPKLDPSIHPSNRLNQIKSNQIQFDAYIFFAPFTFLSFP